MSRKLAAVLMLVGSIAAIVLHVLAQPLVSLLFETGNFTAQDTVTVSSIHSVYAFHIPFFLAGMFYVRLLNSLQANWLVMLGAGANLVASLIAYPLLVDYFGVIGVAAGPVVIYATSVTVLALSAEYSLRLRIRHFEQTQRVQT
jgi:putative peptidoglycan lipid II flippase